MKTEEDKNKKVRELTDEELKQAVGGKIACFKFDETECELHEGCKWVVSLNPWRSECKNQ